MTHTEAYPLTWPAGWPRREAWRREASRFNQTPDRARRQLLEEIRRLYGRYARPPFRREDVIISSNVKLRLDGEPYASQKAPDDPAVAVYFTYKKRPMVFACDRWNRVHDNIYAVALTIEALRGIERWGASDMLERAFTGFAALEHQPDDDWRQVLQMGTRPPHETAADELVAAERHFKILARDAHPDKGGSDDAMTRLIRARDAARRALS